MSLIPASIIKTYAESLGITSLSDEIINALAQDVEYRTREIIQEAAKFMTHSKRTKLSVQDVNHSLQARNVEKLYGYDPAEPLNFRQVPNASIFYVPKEEIDLFEFVQQPLPKAPQPLTLTSHWLAIEGIQPMIPENPATTQELDKGIPSNAATVGGIPSRKDIQEDVEIKPLVKHVLSKELQAYYDAIIFDLLSGDGEKIKAALYSVATDSGLQQLLPYFVQFVAEMIPKNLRSLPQLQIYVGLIGSLLANEHLFIESYLHQLMPPLLSCLLGKRLCEDPEKDDHWSLRDRCAVIVAEICRKFSNSYSTLVPRVAKTMIKALLDKEKPFTCHYGAIVGITALGPHSIDTLLIPHVENYLKALFDAKNEERMTDEEPIATPAEISKCKSALVNAVNRWLRDCTEASVERRSAIAKLFDITIAI